MNLPLPILGIDRQKPSLMEHPLESTRIVAEPKMPADRQTSRRRRRACVTLSFSFDDPVSSHEIGRKNSWSVKFNLCSPSLIHFKQQSGIVHNERGGEEQNVSALGGGSKPLTSSIFLVVCPPGPSNLQFFPPHTKTHIKTDFFTKLELPIQGYCSTNSLSIESITITYLQRRMSDTKATGGIKGFFTKAGKSFESAGLWAKDASSWILQKGGRVGLAIATTSMCILMPLIFEINREVLVSLEHK